MYHVNVGPRVRVRAKAGVRAKVRA